MAARGAAGLVRATVRTAGNPHTDVDGDLSTPVGNGSLPHEGRVDGRSWGAMSAGSETTVGWLVQKGPETPVRIQSPVGNAYSRSPLLPKCVPLAAITTRSREALIGKEPPVQVESE